MFQLTRDDLMHIAPRPKSPAAGAIWDAYCKALTSPEASALFQRYGITTPFRAQHLLATMCGETNFSIIWESGAYSAAGILRVFGAGHHSAAVTEAEAVHIASLAVRPDGSGPRCDALFDRVYGIENPHCCGHVHDCQKPRQICKARELGNDDAGDGAAHRGLGLDQMTGKEDQLAAANKIGCSLDALQQPLNLIHMALIEWQEKGCNHWADEDDAVSIRKLINGGSLRTPISRLNGLPEVQQALRRAKNVITVADFTDDAPEPDTPKDTIALTPSNDDQPDSLAASSEMHASVGTAGIGSAFQAQTFYGAMATSFGQHPKSSWELMQTFAMTLLSDPAFYASCGLIFFGVFLALKRRKRFHIWGV